MLPTAAPLTLYTDGSGLPLDAGYIYFGLPNQNPETAPVTVYWDAAGTQEAAQPLRTTKGYISKNGTRANVFIGVEYSMTVKNKNGVILNYSRTSSDFDGPQASAAANSAALNAYKTLIASAVGAANVGYDRTGRTVEDQLDMLYYGVANLLDTQYAGGADPTGVVAMDAVWSAIIASGAKFIHVPVGTFLAAAQLTTPSGVTVIGCGEASVIKASGQNYHLIGSTSVENVTVRDIKFDGDATANAGLWYLANFDLCTNIRIIDCNFRNAVAGAIRLLDCEKGKVTGCDMSAAIPRVAANTAPYAVLLDGCSATIVDGCTSQYTDFGFVIVGANLASAQTTRAVDDTVGNVVSNCTAQNYAGVAFDINGCHGNTISNCAANYWIDKGMGWFSGFQIKNTASTVECRANKVVGCTSYRGAVAYATQNGSNSIFANNTARLCTRQGFLQNGAEHTQITGLIVDGYGSSAGVGDEVSAVQIQNGGHFCTLEHVTATPSTYLHTNGVTISGSNDCAIDNINFRPGYIRGGGGESLEVGLSIDATSSNTKIGQNVTLGNLLYTSAPISDVSASLSTIYPITCSSVVNVTATGNKVFQVGPQRGMIVGRIRYVTINATSGSPTIQVGKIGNSAFYKAATAPVATAGGQVTTNTAALLSLYMQPNEFPLANVAVAGAAGDVLVSIDGVCAV